MSTPRRLTSPLGIYHVIVRGVNKQCIFEDAEDYHRYLKTLRKYQKICGYKLYAYCLMSNHVHLLIMPGDTELGKIFQHVSPSYAFWFNIKYQHTGHLFQARFMSKPIKNNNHFLTVLRYIHLNPVKAAICSDPWHYEYSSFCNYFDNDLIDPRVVLAQMDRAMFLEFHRKKNNDVCMDIDDVRPRYLSDELAIRIMQDISRCNSASNLQALDKAQRNAILCEMCRAGISVNQASRITGISYGIIQRALMRSNL